MNYKISFSMFLSIFSLPINARKSFSDLLIGIKLILNAINDEKGIAYNFISHQSLVRHSPNCLPPGHFLDNIKKYLVNMHIPDTIKTIQITFTIKETVIGNLCHIYFSSTI